MEECEALCTRLVIMVNGTFKCLGSPQHLKAKFGSGYKITFRLHDEKDQKNLIEFMKAHFPAQLISSTINKRLFEFKIPFKDTKLSTLFKRIEEKRNFLRLHDYSITQTTLDQVFVNFASEQKDDFEQVVRRKKESVKFSPKIEEISPRVSSQSDSNDNNQVDVKSKRATENNFGINEIEIGIKDFNLITNK